MPMSGATLGVRRSDSGPLLAKVRVKRLLARRAGVDGSTLRVACQGRSARGVMVNSVKIMLEEPVLWLSRPNAKLDDVTRQA